MLRRAGRKALSRALLLAGIGCSSACSMLGPASDIGEPQATVVSPEPVTPTPAPEPTVARRPSLPPPAPPPPVRVLVLQSSGLRDFRDVADALAATLGSGYEIERIVLTEAQAAQRVAAIEPKDFGAVVAIGIGAAELAARDLRVPTVFCQVFGYEHLLTMRTGLYGVAALPPLDLQLARWKELAPNVSTVGMIVGESRASLIAQAREAAANSGLMLEAELASSDREALYRFKRLALKVDGLWLFPDNEILSPEAIREMLHYALDHHVHTIVFNPALLQWGALLSVSSLSTDVANTVAHVLHALTTRPADEIPAVTPLTKVDTRVNENVALQLGLVRTPSQASAR